MAPCASLVCLCRAALAFVSSSAMTLKNNNDGGVYSARSQQLCNLLSILVCRNVRDRCSKTDDVNGRYQASIDFVCFIPAGQELAPPNVTLDAHPLQLLCGVRQTPAQSLILQNQLVLFPCQAFKVVLKVIAH